MDRATLTRRSLLSGGIGALAATALSLNTTDANAASGSSFTFVHLTDSHIQPELGAPLGVHKAFSTIRALREKPAFALVGGDLVMDATSCTPARAAQVYDLWQQAARDLALPMHYSIGNHDPYLVNGANRLSPSDPAFGKQYWMKQLGLGATYHSFDHHGWRFIVLDSVGVTPEGGWEGVIDDTQLHWIDDLLRRTPRDMPIVFLTHIPILTIYGLYTGGTTAPLSKTMIVANGKEFKEMIQPYNVKAVLQGHTHVVEECDYLGVKYITSGAVCGDWWKGKRLGVHPEGFVVATAKGQGADATFSWRYVPYGWNAAAYASKAS